MFKFSRNDDNQQRAFELLYQRHKGPLFRFIKKSINHEHDAKEIFQELWFKIINSKEQFNHQQKFTTWAYTIARRLLIDQFRKSGRTITMNGLDASSDSQANEQPLKQPENQFETKQMAKALDHAISLLPLNQRQTFVMKHESGFSIKEIAQITAQPIEQTKSQYRYAVNKIKLAMERFK
ncbi:sigma-70 family RNA polymerase sigma factor [Marinicella litoralis]|nr:sigma-70 family RNA polymerase sigma factor [Marinicella litoralis]